MHTPAVRNLWLPGTLQVSQRFWNSHALVNMSLMLRLEEPTRRRGSRLASALGFGDRQQPQRVASARLVVGAPVQQPEGEKP